MFGRFFHALFKKEVKESSVDKAHLKIPQDQYEADRKDIKRTFGLNFLNEVLQNSTNKPKFAYKIDNSTTAEDISTFLDTFPTDFEFFFFDNFHSQISDPGAYLSVQHYGDTFIYQLGNNGWSSKWKTISKNELIDLIYKNRKHQDGDYIEVYRRYKTVTEGQWP